MEPLLYCLFMLTCFGSPRKDSVLLHSCPSTCQCFHASVDGIGGSDGESFICNDLSFLRLGPSFNTKPINTFVLQNNYFQADDLTFEHKYKAISLVFDKFTVDSNAHKPNTLSVFELFIPKSAKYLSILRSSLGHNEFVWSWLSLFTSLEAIFIDNSQLLALDETFSSLTLDRLHTLVVNSSALRHIDRNTFKGKSNLRKLILANNVLANWNWLTSLEQPLTQLWHLDLSSNHLTDIPDQIELLLPNLQVFHMAHNRLRYFSFDAMLPWLNIDSFQPADLRSHPIIPGQYERNYIYYNIDLELILQIDEIRARYFEESLLNQIGFICANGEKFVNFQDFDKLARESNNVFDYFPDNLRVNSQNKLETMVELDQSVASEVLIEGLNWHKTVSGELFFFDQTSSQTEYRHNQALFMNQLNSLGVTQNAIRVNLFSKIMLDYLVGKRTLSDTQIRLVIDLIVECLDEAGSVGKYVMLIMWKYDNQLLDTLRTVPHYSFSNFESTVLKPMFDRIVHHPALIGVEIIDRFLTGELPQSASSPDQLCEAPYLNSISLQLRFLAFNAQFVKLHSDKKLIGFSIDANCTACLPLTMAKACRKRFGFETLNGFDFITLISNENQAEKEQYSFLNWPINKPDYFDRDDIEEDPPFSTGAIKHKFRGIFYVLHGTIDTTVIANVNSFASGYFLVGD